MAKFKKGVSGNPAGRPKGAKNKSTQFMELLEADIPDLVAVLRKKSLDGDMNAMRLLLDRLIPKLVTVDDTSSGVNESVNEVVWHIVKAPDSSHINPGEEPKQLK